MENLKRYGPSVNKMGFGTMQRLDNGGWVKFSDIKELLQTDNQQLKPEMPSEVEMLTDLGWERLDRDSNQVAHVAHVVYTYIARHFGR
jgi:hypothetical protein